MSINVLNAVTTTGPGSSITVPTPNVISKMTSVEILIAGGSASVQLEGSLTGSAPWVPIGPLFTASTVMNADMYPFVRGNVIERTAPATITLNLIDA